MAPLILKHAEASRPSGERGDDDYNVQQQRPKLL
jgi:hypothetical protein